MRPSIAVDLEGDVGDAGDVAAIVDAAHDATLGLVEPLADQVVDDPLLEKTALFHHGPPARVSPRTGAIVTEKPPLSSR